MPMPIDVPKFSWKCSYQGSIWFDAWDETGTYELELRRSADDYERKFYNGDDSDWQRNVLDMIGVLHRAYSINQEVSASTLHAFNSWRLAEHKKHADEIARQPERYGDYVPAPPFLAHAAARFNSDSADRAQWHWQITARTEEP